MVMTRIMKAAVVTQSNEIKIKEIPIPEIQDDEVLIRVKVCGICGTDYSIYTGKYSREFLPLVPGHEFSGVVTEVGKQVKNIFVGDRVTADINLSCGICFYCSRGQKLLCREFHQLGIHMNGAFAEFVKAPASQVHKLPDNISFEVAAFIEPLSCTIHSAKAMNVALASSVVVVGDGALGIMHTQIAKVRGAAPVILVGKHQSRIEIALKMGVDHVVHFTQDDVVEKVKSLTGGRGADYVIESVGTADTYELAMKLVRPGGRLVAFGITNSDDIMRLKTFDFVLNEMSMVGSCAGVGNDWPDAITLLQYGRIDPKPLFSMKIPLEELEDALIESKGKRSIMKVFVSPDIQKREIFT